MVTDDPELLGMLLDRARLLRQLAVVLRRLGTNSPNRQAINKIRASKRKLIKRELRQVESMLAARVAALFFTLSHEGAPDGRRTEADDRHRSRRAPEAPVPQSS